MATQDKERELIAKERQEDKTLHATMVARAAETDTQYTQGLEEKARISLTEVRQEDDQLQDNMLERSTTEIHE